MRPEHLANFGWALAKSAAPCAGPLREAFTARATAVAPLAEPPVLSSIAWSVATLRIEDGPLMEEIAARCLRDAQDFPPRTLAGVAWAFAKLASAHMPLLEALSDAALAKMRRFQAQEVANTAWARAVGARGGSALGAAGGVCFGRPLYGRSTLCGELEVGSGPRSEY